MDPEPDGSQDSSVEPAQATEEETGPSNIELYQGDASFSLELRSAQGLEALSYQEIYAKVSPSVVTITVYGDYGGAYATGIILSEDGYILTNQHVVALQSYAQVTTADNQVYDALLVGEDPNSDLALLKVEAQGLTPAEFGTSDELVVGDECFAIGNPLGMHYRGSFSNGIVSALNRNVNMNDYTMSLIQTTAALNSGNSGGPLINIYGQVIGVNNMKIMQQRDHRGGPGLCHPLHHRPAGGQRPDHRGRGGTPGAGHHLLRRHRRRPGGQPGQRHLRGHRGRKLRRHYPGPPAGDIITAFDGSPSVR